MVAKRSAAARELRGLIWILAIAVGGIIAAKTGLLAAAATWFGDFFGGQIVDKLTDATATP